MNWGPDWSWIGYMNSFDNESGNGGGGGGNGCGCCGIRLDGLGFGTRLP